MSAMEATFFDGRSAAGYPVRLQLDEGFGVLRIRDTDTGQVLKEYPFTSLKLEAPVGAGSWVLSFGEGAVCRIEAASAEELAHYIPPSGLDRFMGWAEGRLRIALLCLAVSVAAVALFFLVGIPALAERTARQLPPEFESIMAREAMRVLDRTVFQPSALDLEEQERIRAVFAGLAEEAERGSLRPYRIEFRRSRIGPNAFALPGGLILMTDELVAFADSPEQIHGVLAHELGHVHHQHPTRAALQAAGNALVVTVFLGEVSSVLSLGAAIPTLLIETGYSRRFEREADTFAGEFGMASGIGVDPLIEILEALTRHYGAGGQLAWMATHPPTPERAELLRAIEKAHRPDAE